MYVEKLRQCTRYLEEFDIDVWLVFTGDGEDPCLPLITGLGTVGMGFFLFTRHHGRIAICHSIDAQDLVESELFDEVVPYATDPGATLREQMSKIQPKTCALNYSIGDNLSDGLTTGRYRWLLAQLGDSFAGEFVSSEPFLSRLRAVKSKTEIETIREAISLTQAIYADVFRTLRVGMSEIDVGQLFVHGMSERQLVNAIDRTCSMPIVMKERIAHRAPSVAMIVPGDLLIMDFSVDYRGYASDIARTVYFAKPGETVPPKPMLDVFEAIHTAISLAAEALRPGVQGYEVDAVARDYLKSQGLPDITHSTGHQLGRQVHDGGTILGPRWPRYGTAPFGEVLEGMVFTLEPTVFLDDGRHFIVEENVVVTANGAEFLSRRQDQLFVIDKL